jgi:hypothetical protein
MGPEANRANGGLEISIQRVPQFIDNPPHLSAPQMFVAIKDGIRYSGMGAWDGMMSDEEIWKVETFLEHIGSLPPEVEANWKTTQ